MSQYEMLTKSLLNEAVQDQHTLADTIRQQITKSAPQFVSVEYTNTKGETSRQVINVGIAYQSVLEGSFNALNKLDRDVIKQEAALKNIDAAVVDQAFTDVEASLSARISRPEQVEIGDVSNFTTLSKGVKMHQETGELYLSGQVISKTIITPGTYKEVKSRPLTLAKKMIEKHLPVSKYRALKISANQIHSVKSQGTTLVID